MGPSSNYQLWQRAVALFSQVTGFIVLPVMAALYGGRALDRKYDSEPIGFVSLTILATIIATLAIIRLSQRYLREIEQTEANQKLNHVNTRNSFPSRK